MPPFGSSLSNRIIPCLRAFSPDLILISAGFDGGCGDIGNSKRAELALDLTTPGWSHA